MEDHIWHFGCQELGNRLQGFRSCDDGKIDAGDIVAQQELMIGRERDAGQLMQRQHQCQLLRFLTEAVNAMAQGTIDPSHQNIGNVAILER